MGFDVFLGGEEGIVLRFGEIEGFVGPGCGWSGVGVACVPVEEEY